MHSDSGVCCFIQPAAYEIDNIGTIRIGELIRFSGNVANQIKDLPPGSPVEFKIVD